LKVAGVATVASNPATASEESCRAADMIFRRRLTDTVEKVPKCLLVIFSKETKLSSDLLISDGVSGVV
jgi:hypothetical protein